MTPVMTDSPVVEFDSNKLDMDKDVECPFCKENGDTVQVESWRRKSAEHLIVTINSSGEIHVHGPVKNTTVITKMIGAIVTEHAKAITQA